DFVVGIDLHRKIDAYTDGHPVFRRSVSRIIGPLRRYGGILVDLFYDHFLARDWASHSSLPLAGLVEDFHTSIDTFRSHLPELAYVRLTEIRDRGYLLSYGNTEGVAEELQRISARLRRPVNLAAGMDDLLADYDSFASDFNEFYPQLRKHVGG
ncbi:MAG: acyl carrier protein phosphodiesterase, partial [Verrucomicrobiales bacterium]|nr:acyl carrier protein phosphodiesterase [Verrucomicrobiales bacterium]